MRITAPALIATNLVAAAAGYVVAHHQPAGADVPSSGYPKPDAGTVITATVDSLRLGNRLLVLSYRGTVRVQADRSILWLFRGHQELIVPAIVPYYIDLSKLTLSDVTFDERVRLVRVKLPRLTVGDAAFLPEEATTINAGTLTYSEAEVETLRKMNFTSARRAVFAQAQQRPLADAARRQAVADVQQYFEIPLRIAGMPDVKVVASFG